MTSLKTRRLGGLWITKTSTGKELWSGKFKQADITEALAEVASDGKDVAVTIWVNREEDKRNANSPDGSLVIGEQYKKPSESNAPAPALNSDDIPF